MSKRKRQSKPRTFEGLQVVDGAKSFKLSISKDDIKNSKKNDPANCAAARACQRKFHKEARVFLTRTYIKDKNKWIRFVTPVSVGREITAFDRGAAFEPGEYQLNAVSPSQQLGQTRGRTKHTNTGENKKPHHITVNVRPSPKKN